MGKISVCMAVPPETLEELGPLWVVAMLVMNLAKSGEGKTLGLDTDLASNISEILFDANLVVLAAGRLLEISARKASSKAGEKEVVANTVSALKDLHTALEEYTEHEIVHLNIVNVPPVSQEIQ